MPNITGTLVAYYVICPRKAWLFSKGISYEFLSELVALGKLIDETTFKKESLRNIAIDDIASIDFIRYKGEVIVNEIKKSKKMEIAHIWQVKFYMYLLRKMGIKNVRGIIRYPKLYKKIDVVLSDEDETKMETLIENIGKLLESKTPPEPIYGKNICIKCAYRDYCFI